MVYIGNPTKLPYKIIYVDYSVKPPKNLVTSVNKAMPRCCNLNENSEKIDKRTK
jgi:hypothetical protein